MASEIVLEVSPSAVGEGAGATTLTVTGTLDGAALTTDTVVSLTLEAGTATAGADYTVGSAAATLRIAAMATSGTASFALTPVDDMIDDDDETVTIASSSISTLTLTPASLTVTITDNDEPNVAPVFEPLALTYSLEENSGADVAVGAAVTATDANGDTLSYSLGGTGAGSFRIDSASGQISTAPGAAYDYESATNRFALTVTANDPRGGNARATVMIDISDVDEPPPRPAAPSVSPTRGETDSLDVSWIAPSTSGRPGISGYELQYRTGGDPWASWSHTGTGIVATIDQLSPDTNYDVQVRAINDEGESRWSPSGDGSTFSTDDPCLALGPTPTMVAVPSVPIVVASTTDVYFVLYVTHELDGAEVLTPVAVVVGKAGTTTLGENVEALPAGRYRVEQYNVADPADIDGDCIDDLTELAVMGRMNPLNPAPAILRNDGAVAIPDSDTFEELSYTEPGDDYEYVKFALLDMDTDHPLLYFINSTTHLRHPIVLFLDAIGHTDPDLPWAILGEIVYDPDLVAADGTQGVYYFWFVRYDGRYTFSLLDRAHALLTAAMPLLGDIAGDKLSMYIPNHRLPGYQADLETLRDSRIPLLFNEDIYPDTDFLALNPEVGYGLLRVMEPGERPSPLNIVIYESLPNELPRVGGIITTVPQTPLSHVNLRAVQDSVPNAYIKDAIDKEEINALIARYVRYEVTADGYKLRAATKAEVDAHHAASRPARAQFPERDLSVTEITPLSDVGFEDWRAFGVKAANVAVLGTLGFPEGTVPNGFAIPFHFYNEFMNNAVLKAEKVFGKGTLGTEEDRFTLAAGTKLIDAVKAILVHPKFQTDFEIQDEMLDDLREVIEEAESPLWMKEALTAMHAECTVLYGDECPVGRSLRYRSSTNNEDLPGFSGAGLYDSNTQKQTETENEGIDKSMKQVFASLWNFRAFTEREFHRIDHLATAMGVLVHPNYSDELANGVAASFDPVGGLNSYYYLNTQLGEDLVTNPEANSEPEEILLHQSGDYYEILATSNQVAPGTLLMSDAQMKQLAEHLTVIHEKFAGLYGSGSNRPFAIEIEFKITEADILAIKQARPWVFSDSNPPPPPDTVEPTITTRSNPSPYRENGTGAVYTFQARDPQGGAVSWSVTGTDSHAFDISSSGALIFGSPPDFENPIDSNRDNVYEIAVVVTDDQYLTDSVDVVITVTNHDEGVEPTISSRGPPSTYAENRTTTVYIFRASDPQRQAIAWTLEGADRGDFTLTRDGSGRGVLAFIDPPDFEAPGDSDGQNDYELTVVATDPDSHADRLSFTITVTDVNEGPEVIGGGDSFNVRENRNWQGASFTGFDPEGGSVTRWALGGRDGGDFTITETGVMTFRSVPDYERPADSDRDNVYEVEVRPYDGRYYGSHPVTVTVEDVPEITGPATHNRAENFEGTLGDYLAVGRGDLTVEPSWSLSGTDGGDFTIDENGQLSFRSEPDYERPVDSNRDNTYQFTVRATDDRYYGTLDVTVTVTAVNEPPTITTTSTSATNLRQPENRTSRLYTYRATDPEGANTVTWSVAGVDRDFFTIDERGQFSFSETSPPDYEQPGDSGRDNVYNVVIQANDDDNNTAPLDVTVTVTGVNEGPEVTGGGNSFSVQENRDWPGAAFTGFDPEGGSVTRWALGGRDGGDFTITETGVMNFRSVPDYERPADSHRDNVYEVEVRPYDGRYYGSHHVTVTVEDVNEITGPATLNRAENFEGTLGSYLAGGRGDLTVEPNWSLSGTDGGDFTIDENGQLTFRSVPDYERPADSNRDNTYGFTVQATDDRYYGTLDVTLTVTPVNEPPTITTTSTSATNLRQSENRTSRLYTYRATDPEGAGTVSWSVNGVDGRFFVIDERGRFSFSETSPPDYELPGDSGGDNVYNVVIQATDDDSNTAPLDVTITVTDVNEGPEVIGGGNSFSVQENRDWQGATFTGFDPEGGSVTRWALGGRDGRDFVISETGVMTFRSAPDHERPADSNRDNVYEVEVRPYDGRYYGSHPVTVTVEDVPEITGPATHNRSENFEGTLGSYLAGGRGDLTVEPNWSLSGTDGGDFTIDESGQLTFRSVPDYERPADSNRDNTYVFTVRATDDRYYGTLDMTVTVEAVNEPPSITTTSTSATVLKQPENRTSRLYTYRATDPEGANTVTWSVAGVDRDFFTIDERGQFSFSETSPPDYEQPGDSGRDNVYNVVIQANDDDNNTAPLDVTITVTDVNEGPEVTGPPSFIIQENLWLPTAVYTAFDPEGANVARWNVGGRDGGDFFITQGGTLYFRNVPDYERPADSNRDNVYEVLIQPYDGRNTGSYAVTITVTDVNEKPEFRSGSRTSFTQPENRTSRLYSFSATDPEGSAVTWSVGGTDGSHFTIDERGQFSFNVNDPPDFDTPADQGGDSIYNATIQARDPEDNTGSLRVMVMVTEVNEGPVITRQGSAPGSVPENIDQSTVLARYTASDPERPSVRITQWSTAGRDGGDFAINALGELRFRNSPDYERPADSNRDNVYEVTIRASDGRYTSTLDEVQIVTVTGVNEAPTITTTSRTAFAIQENRTSTLYTFRATDPEGGTITWTAAGTDGNAFTMDDRGALSFANPPDFDAPADADRDNVYNLTVQARDPEGNPDTLAVTVTVTDHNEGVEPTISTRRPPSTYRENGTSTVYTFRASDPQRGVITWTVTGTDGSSFAITPDSSGRGVLTFNGPPDFESPTDADRDNVYELAVLASDDEGHSDRVDFTITVTDHDEGVEPTISTRRPPVTYRENDTRTVYTFRASDPQRGSIAWTVTGTDSGAFGITRDSSGRGVLTFNSPPDFESPTDSNQDNAYQLAVVATDDERHTDSVAFTIAITNVDEGPQIRLDGTARTSVAENLEQDTVLAKYMAADPENPSASIFRWSTSGRDGGDFVINELGELRFRHSPDFERPADSNRDNVYELMVRAYDGRTYGTLEEPLLITVTQVNEAPVITTKSRTAFSLRENSTSNIYTYRATDQDVGDVVSWSVEGPDADDFAIFDGVLNFRLLPDLEIPADADEDNVYEITVVAADTGGLRDAIGAVITITDQSEGPVIAGPAFHTVAENYDIAQVLGSYTATDAKDNRTVHPQWSLSGRDGGDFVIDRHSGVLTFRNAPDYDRPADSNRDNIYEFTVRGHDSRAYGHLDVTVTVTPVNEGAPVVTGRTSHSVRENTATVIHTYRATDPDLNDSITWSTDGPDGHLFQVSERGELSFRAGPDFETPLDTGQDNVYELEVVATDGEGLRGTLEVTVTVTAINEGPEVSGPATFTVNENQDLSNGATYTARDPEAVGGATTTITWSASGRDGGDFTIDRETGLLTFRTLPDHERPADSNRDNVYEFTVRAHDGRNYGHFDVTVMVEDVNEITGPATLSRPENFRGVLATYSPAGRGVLDVEPEWRLTGTDGGDFTIGRETGELSFRNLPDHERPADSNRDNVYSFAVQVSSGSYYETLEVSVTVTPENEPPAITGRDSLSFRENTPATTRLYTYRATDPEGDAFTWDLGGLDASDFTITVDSSGRGVLTFAASPDFDRPAGSGSDANQYLVTIQARDVQGDTGELPVTVTVTDQNEGATVTGENSIAVVENRDPTIVLARYSAVDPEGEAITRWSLSGSDGGDFLINENGELSFRNTPDYDRPADSNRDNEYLVTVRAYDGRTYGNLDVTITVSNVNEHAPVIRSGSRTSFTYREEGTPVLYTYSATDGDKDDVITWTTEGTDGNLFKFNERNGLVFREPPDYENPGDSGGNNEYDLTVVATDTGGLTATLEVTITVTAVEEGPEITGTTTHTVTENQDLAGATFTARDPEDPDAEVSRWSLAGSDAGDFTITDTSQQTGQNSAEMTFRNPPDYDRPADSNRDNEYLVKIRAYNGNTYGSLDVKVTVTDLNESDPVVSGRDTLSFRENTPVASRLYRYSVRDDDRDTTFIWSMRGPDGGEFTINDQGELHFSSPPNHEQPADSNSDNVYEIVVVASDGGNEGTLDISITVTDVNEGPDVSGQDSRRVSENFSQVLATYTASDPEDPTAAITRWSTSGRDGGDFTVNESGELTFRTTPDFERPADSDRNNEYQFTVRASDGRIYGTYDVTVTVDDVNEAPEFRSGSRTSFSYRENGTSSLYTYRATDPEGSDVEWSLRGDDASDFVISESGVLSFARPPNFDSPAGSGTDGNEYLVTVVATDDGTYGAEGQLTGAPLDGPLHVTVTVTGQNEGPIITETSDNTAFTVSENHEAVLFIYAASDPEGEAISHWSTSGRDGGDFTISESGELTFRNPPDFERPADSNRDNVYELTVRASDGRYYGTLDATVTVQAVDESPEFRSRSQDSFVYKENGTSDIYTYRATDPEGADVAWGWSGTDSSAFTLNEAGVLSFVSPPDYESPTDSGRDNVYELVVEASDEQPKTTRLEVTVTVTNLTDARASIQGTAQVGRTLTADTSGIPRKGSRDGPAFSYQWMADDKDIEGATGSTYKVADEDQGKALKVKVTFTDDEGNEETVASAPTDAVAGKSNSPATGVPTISGTAQVGETLTADASGIADADGLTSVAYQYQWLADGADIAGATDSAYTLAAADEGAAIRVRVSFTDDAGHEETLTSKATDAVAAAELAEPPAAPTGLRAAPSHDRVVLSWDDPQDDTITGYVILRRDRAIHEIGTFATVAGDTGAADTGYTDDQVQPEKEYVYRIRAINEHEVSELSGWVRADTPAPPSANSPATGQPTISGTAQVAETLTADTSGISDQDGLTDTPYSYQWLADGADIAGATDSTYTLADADEGAAIRVRVSFTDDAGDEETLTSAATDTVEARANTPATGVPSISGTAQIGETLTADASGIADADGLTSVAYQYQWLADGANIAGATAGIHTLTDSEEGNTIQVEVSFSDDAGNQEELTSAATAAVDARPNSQATGVPTISGAAQVGETLTVDISGIADQDGLNNVTYSYQWVADDKDIEGATGSTYKVADEDQGKALKVKVTFTDDEGNEEELASAATATVAGKSNSPATGQPSISGTAQVGETLTADASGISDEDGLSSVAYIYQWLADGADIAGATDSAYTLAAADEGAAIRVRVSFTDDAGNEETLTSAATDTVEAAELAEPPAAPTGLRAAPSHDRVVLSWDDPQDDTITGYVILRRDRAIHEIGTFATVAGDTGAADTGYTDDQVQPEKEYVYRIRAINEHGVSELSGWVRADTPAPPSANSPATGQPTISGTAQVAETLTADMSGIADQDGLTDTSYSYQWLADGADIAGATDSTYTLADADEGAAIRVRVSFTDDAGNEETLTSAATDTVEARANTPATGVPTISGTAQIGETLTADASGIADADGLTSVAYQYQWLADGANIAGATDSTYTLVDADAGAAIKVRVSLTDDAGHEETLTSAATDTVDARPNTPATGVPTISGTAQVGETLTAGTSDIADDDGLTNVVYGYQWLADGTDIAGATATTHTLTDADEGAAIKVRVSFTDDAGNEEELSSAATRSVVLPLTGSLHDAPDVHDGRSEFTFELRFSEELKLSYKKLRDHAFTVTGGTVQNAQRFEKSSNIRWRITVMPDSDSAVHVLLPETTRCGSPGGICAGGRKFSSRLELTVPGPQQ